jgi:hypothetical protein
LTAPLLLFSGLLLLLAIKGDGHFPLPAATPEPVFQLYGLGLTLLFGVGLVRLVRRGSYGPSAGSPTCPSAGCSPPLRAAAAVASLFIVLDGGVLLLEARRYASFGYAWRPVSAILICSLPALACAWIALRRRPVRPAMLLALAAGAHGALILYACACFPLAAARSDMMPLLMQAGRELLAGHDPYSLYHLTPGSGTYLTYLPGLLLAYLPAALMGLDPRLLGVVYTLAAAGLLYLRAGAGAAVFLSVFLVNPYLVYRHDAYLAPFWLLLAASWIALSRPRPATIAASCGVLAMTSQLLAVPACVMAIFGFRRYGLRAMVGSLLAAAAACAAVLGLFLLPNFTSFVSGTVGHWQDALNVESLGVTFWLLLVLPAPFVHTLQAVLIMALLLFPWLRPRPVTAEKADRSIPSGALPRPGSSAPWLPGIDPDRSWSVFATSALALFAFAALNTVIWTYFYLAVLFLAMLAQLDPKISSPETLAD